MVPIYICDDNRQFLKQLKEVINRIILINQFDMQVVEATDSPEKLLDERERNGGRSIYFLDIDLKSEVHNGFTLAKEIRKSDARGFLVFVTTHGELMADTFKYHVEAVNYIIKDRVDVLREQVGQSLCEINELVKVDNCDLHSYYTVKSGEIVYQIPMEEMLFFEVSGSHRLTLCSECHRIEFGGNLNEIEEELQEQYLRVHQSFLVNREAIVNINKRRNILLLKDGSEIPVSRRGRRVLG
ncbi:MAG: LytR/AlgR family response regulator transcription factor [Lachnospiraceae bacterium]